MKAFTKHLEYTYKIQKNSYIYFGIFIILVFIFEICERH